MMLDFKSEMFASMVDMIGANKLVALHQPIQTGYGYIYAQRDFNSVFWVEYRFKDTYMNFWICRPGKARVEFIAEYHDGKAIKRFLDAVLDAGKVAS